MTIRNGLGMHARAAAKFARVASAYDARITVTRQGRTMDGKSIMGLLLLAAPKGAEMLVEADGPDETAALEALAALVDQGFGEESQ